MEERLHEAMDNNRNHFIDKQMSVKYIIEQERQFMRDRYNQDLRSLAEHNQHTVQTTEATTAIVKNKNERLQKGILEKEQSVLEF